MFVCFLTFINLKKIYGTVQIPKIISFKNL